MVRQSTRTVLPSDTNTNYAEFMEAMIFFILPTASLHLTFSSVRT